MQDRRFPLNGQFYNLQNSQLSSYQVMYWLLANTWWMTEERGDPIKILPKLIRSKKKNHFFLG